MNMGLFLADAAPATGGNFMQTIIMVGFAVVFFYFILIRPEQKRRKVMEARRESMKIGDTVVAMNIVGTLDQVRDKTVVLKMEDGTKIEVVKIAITDVQSKS